MVIMGINIEGSENKFNKNRIINSYIGVFILIMIKIHYLIILYWILEELVLRNILLTIL